MLFVVSAASLTPVDVKQNSRAHFWSLFQILGKHKVYEPNFAICLVISTLILCSMCLMMRDFFQNNVFVFCFLLSSYLI